MTASDAADPEAPNPSGYRPSVFLSYASEDRQAARMLQDALTSHGLDVWYDESALGGGEAWDQKIRRQIRECSYFLPVVSAQTERRHEGYFRREWRLAVERTLDMADDHLFLLPVVIDDTDQSVARVPEKFLSVQWLKVPGGRTTPALETLCRRIASGNDAAEAGRAKSPAAGRTYPAAAARANPEFPREQPGHKMRHWVQAAGWMIRAAWAQFKRLPRWVRAAAYAWIGIALIARCDSSSDRDSPEVTPEKVEKLKSISKNYEGSLNKHDLVKLGTEIAREFAGEAAATGSPLLAIAFTAPADDAAAAKLADSAFAMTYGMISISHRGQVALTKEPLPSADLGAALERGRANHSNFVLCGAIDKAGGAPVLTVKIAAVADGAVVWSKSYAAAGADATKIAADVDANVPSLDPK